MGGGMGQRTSGYCADETPGQISLLRKVQPRWYLRSIEAIGPVYFRRVRHGLNVCSSSIPVKGGSGANKKDPGV